MQNCGLRGTALALILMTGVAVGPGRAQQPAQTAPAKPPASQAPAPANKPAARPRTAKAAPSTKKPETPVGKVVLKVGDQQVTQNDIEFLISGLNQQVRQAVAAEGRRPVGQQYAVMLVLSRQAQNDHLDSLPTFRQEMALHRLQMLAQAEYERMAGQASVTPEEVSQFYRGHQTDFEEAQVREYVVRKRPEGAKEGTPGLPPQEARTRLDAIRKSLAAGTDPKKVVKDFVVPNDVLIDAEPRTVRRGQLLAALDKAAFEGKDGDLSEPLDTPQAMVFLQVVGHRRPELKEVAPDVENTLRQQKIETAVAELRNKATIWMDEEYFKAPSTANAAPVPRSPGAGQPPKP